MSRQHPALVIAPDPVTHVAVSEIAVQMNLLKARLGHMHLFKTMHALDEATRALGWEAADILANSRD